MPRDLDILILAAGRGSRMQSDLPKVLHSLMGEPLLQHVLDAAFALKPREVGVIVGHRREDVKAAVAGQGLSFILQKDQKGTGHAVKCAARRFGGRKGHVMVLSGDVPLMRPETLATFLAAHKKSRVPASLITASLEDPGSLGRIIRNPKTGRVDRIVEARDASPEELAIREINSGIYLFRNEELFEGLKKVKRHANSGEFYLTDVVKQLTEAGRKVHAEEIADPSEAMGINTLDELQEAQGRLRRRIARDHAARGVEIVDPSTTFIHKGVNIGSGTVVWPFSVLMGSVSIGARCRIGPFAHLREGTVVEDGATLGSFVEVKASRIGAEARASHLAYLGDAEVGAGANVGAGAVTANFDGKDKHRTRIGPGAFIGSGSVLVAPIDIGPDAVVGAGAVVTAGRDVPAGSTVVGVPATEQEAKEKGSRKRGGRKATRK